MQTNFFRQIAKLNLKGDLQITLRQSTENSFVLSVLLNNEQCADEARKTIPPLNLRGQRKIWTMDFLRIFPLHYKPHRV